MTAQNRRRHDPLKARNASGINLAINRIEQWQLLSDLVALRGLRKKSLWRTPPAPSTWLEFLWRGCMKISDSEITGIQMKKINISPAQSGLLSHSPSWTIRWSHVNYDKWGSGGMCVLRQAFFFPLLLWWFVSDVMCNISSASITEGVYCQCNHCRSYQRLYSPDKSATCLTWEFNPRLNKHTRGEINWEENNFSYQLIKAIFGRFGACRFMTGLTTILSFMLTCLLTFSWIDVLACQSRKITGVTTNVNDGFFNLRRARQHLIRM